MGSVAVVSCIYGHSYDSFVFEWKLSLQALDRRPDEIILHRGEPGEKYPQPRLMNEAVSLAKSEWIWQLNVDDIALPDALNGIDTVAADVWLMGYTQNGNDYTPTSLPNREYKNLSANPYPSMSAYRREAFLEVGGYPIIAHEDWGLWRRLARAGCTFESSGRVHSVYRDHPIRRSVTELLTSDPEAMLREVMDD